MDEIRKKVMHPHHPATGLRDSGVLLVLDNGVRIESRSVARSAGSQEGPIAGNYILVADKDGYEIGYWNAQEWGEDPVGIMSEILETAARGCAKEES